MGKKPFHNLLPVLAAYMFGSINIFVFLQIFYLVGFGLFCLEALLSLWVLQVRDNSFDLHSQFLYCFSAMDK